MDRYLNHNNVSNPTHRRFSRFCAIRKRVVLWYILYPTLSFSRLCPISQFNLVSLLLFHQQHRRSDHTRVLLKTSLSWTLNYAVLAFVFLDTHLGIFIRIPFRHFTMQNQFRSVLLFSAKFDSECRSFSL